MFYLLTYLLTYLIVSNTYLIVSNSIKLSEIDSIKLFEIVVGFCKVRHVFKYIFMKCTVIQNSTHCTLSYVKVGSHRRSDQLDRPDRPNSPTNLDQTRSSSTNCLIGVVHEFFPTATRPCTTSTRPFTTPPRLQPDNHPDLYTTISTSTRLVHD